MFFFSVVQTTLFRFAIWPTVYVFAVYRINCYSNLCLIDSMMHLDDLGSFFFSFSNRWHIRKGFERNDFPNSIFICLKAQTILFLRQHLNESLILYQSNDVRVKYLVFIKIKSIAKWEIVRKMIGLEIDARHNHSYDLRLIQASVLNERKPQRYVNFNRVDVSGYHGLHTNYKIACNCLIYTRLICKTLFYMHLHSIAL